MTAIAEHLERTLKSLPAAAAASVERLVWDVIGVVESQPKPASEADVPSSALLEHRAHWRKVDAMLDEVDWSDFERPAQGVSEVREG